MYFSLWCLLQFPVLTLTGASSPLPAMLLQGILGAGLGFSLFLMISMATNGSIGGGDIQLVAILGFYYQAHGLFIIVLLSCALALSKRLMTRPELCKLLFIISDGQPAGYGGYYGTSAEADLRGIKAEYEKKGLTLFAAAIGDDKDNIKRIYGDGFIDISNLNKLPVNLGKILIAKINQKYAA